MTVTLFVNKIWIHWVWHSPPIEQMSDLLCVSKCLISGLAIRIIWCCRNCGNQCLYVVESISVIVTDRCSVWTSLKVAHRLHENGRAFRFRLFSYIQLINSYSILPEKSYLTFLVFSLNCVKCRLADVSQAGRLLAAINHDHKTTYELYLIRWDG